MAGGNHSRNAIAVADMGSTNTKLVVFDENLSLLGEESIPSRHCEGPPYKWIDPEPALSFVADALKAFDGQFGISTVVPCAHGSGLALLQEDGELALPIMDYEAQPPDDIVDSYAAIAPPFSEVFAPTNPGALTLGLQLHWQETAFPQRFSNVQSIVPWGQYVSYRLSGVPVSEITALGAQTHLWDVRKNNFSSLVRDRNWATRFAPLWSAWNRLGPLLGSEADRPTILTGIHDSNANFLRYMASIDGDFTLLSTGTWIIGFAKGASLSRLDPTRDTATNTDIYGAPTASCRFMGGREHELIADGAPADAGSMSDAEAIIEKKVFATASFTDLGGPLPGTGGKGQISRTDLNPAQRSALAALYCALMTEQSLSIIHHAGPVIVDGPFAANTLFLRILAALLPGIELMSSNIRNGTMVGAALLALADKDGRIPPQKSELAPVRPAEISGLRAYRDEWLRRSITY